MFNFDYGDEEVVVELRVTHVHATRVSGTLGSIGLASEEESSNLAASTRLTTSKISRMLMLWVQILTALKS
jgi:hypothetical protein